MVFPHHKFDAEKQAVYRVALDYHQIHKKNNDSLIQHGLILWYDHLCRLSFEKEEHMND